MEKAYHTITQKDTQALTRFLVQNGQFVLPLVSLIEQSRLAIDELIDVLGRAQIEAVLRLSAQGVAGPPRQGKQRGETGWHGSEAGTVCLRERKLRVRRPHLRGKGRGAGKEIPVPP